MPTDTNRADRLYNLLPVILRMRDAEGSEPLRALLQVIAEQVNVVEDDIRQMYDNWFIETAEDWVVPYIGDLIGYTPVHAAGQPGDPNAPRDATRNRILMPRREVANTLRYRRRKGALALLEELARDVAGWPSRAVEFYTLLGWTQNLNHLHLDRGRWADLRGGDALERLGGPFDSLSHGVDVRRINSTLTPGRYNIPSVGLFVWRLRSYSMTRAPASALKGNETRYFFNPLGHDTPLFARPVAETDPTHIAEEVNVPAPIRRRAFEERSHDAGGTRTQASATYYGEGKSVAIWADNWAGYRGPGPIPREQIRPANLADWQYQPQDGYLAVDPALGRIAFPAEQPPDGPVIVTYHYGFSADIGGGEYERPIDTPADAVVYTVGDTDDAANRQHTTVGDALDAWRSESPDHGVIEFARTWVYTLYSERPLVIELGRPGQSLQLRAAQRTRPILRLLDLGRGAADALTFRVAPGTRVTLDGLLITGNAVVFKPYVARPPGPAAVTPAAPKTGALPVPPGAAPASPDQPATGTAIVHVPGAATGSDCPDDQRPPRPRAVDVVIQHCTLVPGWTLGPDCDPERGDEPSLVIDEVNADVRIERTILGSIWVDEDEVTTDPIPIRLSDSILDATDLDCDRPSCVALSRSGPRSPWYAHAVLTVLRSTVFGRVLVHAIDLGENSIFYSPLQVARTQIGCLRFCYVTPVSRTPRRYECQPDTAVAALEASDGWATHPQAVRDSRRAAEVRRVRPVFDSRQYGRPTYARLSLHCADEIRCGADDESEMGVYHDLYQPQRAANLRARLEEFTPAGLDVAILFAD